MNENSGWESEREIVLSVKNYRADFTTGIHSQHDSPSRIYEGEFHPVGSEKQRSQSFRP